jgi:RimJ/RimL family protein N-acetyltransferase
MFRRMTSPIRRFFHNASLGWNKFTSFLPIYGIRGTTALLLRNFLWVELNYRLEKDLGIADPEVKTAIPINVVSYCKGFDVSEWKSRKEIEKIRGKFGLTRFHERLDRGEILFVGYCRDNIVGFVWIQFAPNTEAGYALSNNEAYTLDGWTFEEYRGKRVLPAIQQAIMRYVRENRPEIGSIVTHIALGNRASIAGDQRAGYVVTKKEISFALFGWYRRVVLRTYQSSRIHEELRQRK